jgi:hypothetical protein
METFTQLFGDLLAFVYHLHHAERGEPVEDGKGLLTHDAVEHVPPALAPGRHLGRKVVFHNLAQNARRLQPPIIVIG